MDLHIIPTMSIEFPPSYDDVIQEDNNIKFVRRNGMKLCQIIKQTELICVEAVKQNGYALQYVEVQTENICLEAV
jgi:hypothetical protein